MTKLHHRVTLSRMVDLLTCLVCIGAAKMFSLHVTCDPSAASAATEGHGRRGFCQKRMGVAKQIFTFAFAFPPPPIYGASACTSKSEKEEGVSDPLGCQILVCCIGLTCTFSCFPISKTFFVLCHPIPFDRSKRLKLTSRFCLRFGQHSSPSSCRCQGMQHCQARYCRQSPEF